MNVLDLSETKGLFFQKKEESELTGVTFPCRSFNSPNFAFEKRIKGDRNRLGASGFLR